MRSKEEAHDYRYFPCPDLLPLELEETWVEKIRANLPELPDEKKNRFMTDYGLTNYDAGVLTADVLQANFFEDVAKNRDGKLTANWIINELFGRLNKEELSIKSSPISTIQLGQIIDLISSKEISGKIAKELFEIVWEKGGDPKNIVKEKGMTQVTDAGAIEAEVDKIISENPNQVEKAKSNPKLAGWFTGQVLKATSGKANPALVSELVHKKLFN